VAAWLDAAQLGPAIFEIVNAATPANVNPVQSKTASLTATGNKEQVLHSRPTSLTLITEAPPAMDGGHLLFGRSRSVLCCGVED
jgi:hypothetical protein